jgi:hypothetical protein
MVLPDLLEVQSDCSFYIDCGVSENEVHLLSDTVNNYHDDIVAMSLGQLDNEVDTDGIPSIFWSLCRVGLSIRLTSCSLVRLQRSQVLT